MSKIIGFLIIAFIGYLALVAVLSVLSVIWDRLAYLFNLVSRALGLSSGKVLNSDYQEGLERLEKENTARNQALEAYKKEQLINGKREIIISIFDAETVFERIWKKEKSFASNATIQDILTKRLIEISSQTKSDEITADINDYIKSLFGHSSGTRSIYIKEIVGVFFSKYRKFEKDRAEFEKLKTRSSIKAMSGQQFEEFVTRLLKEKGAQCILTPKNGDFGADIIATFNGLKIAIQCKRYKDKVGFDAVKEVYVGKDIYKCNTAWVISNSSYSKQAIESSKSLNVRLIHIDELLYGTFDFMNSPKTERVIVYYKELAFT